MVAGPVGISRRTLVPDDVRSLRWLTLTLTPGIPRLRVCAYSRGYGAGPLQLDLILGASFSNHPKLHLYPSRLFVPTLVHTDQIEVRQEGGMLEVLEGEQVVADYSHWNSGWGPVRPTQLSGACGAALVSRGTAYREVPASEGQVVRSFYLWQVRILQRNSTQEASDEILKGGVFFV